MKIPVFRAFGAAAATTLTAGLLASAAHAQFFANAGFETPSTSTADGAALGGTLLQSNILNAGGGANPNTFNPSWTFANGGGITVNGGPFGSPGETGSAQVGLLQEANSGFNERVGFAQAGTYKVQLADAQRGGNVVNQTIQISVDGNVVSTLTPASSAAFGTQTTASFNVTAGSHNIAIVGVGAGATDISAFVDNVKVVSAATGVEVPVIPVTNGSFEDFIGGVGYGTPAGWTATGAVGTNRAATQSGFFADNGTTPDGGSVGFLQGAASLSQTLSGFTLGGSYVLTFFDNARSGPVTVAPVVTLGTQTLFGSPSTFIGAVGGTNPYNFISVPFTYTAAFNGGSTSAALKFASTTLGGGDGTFLLDGVQVSALASAAPEPGSVATFVLGGIGVLGAGLRRRRA
jgi:hypothetical protein